MSEWREVNLDEIVKFQRGHDLTVANILEGSYPVAGSNGVIGYHNQFTTMAPGITLGRSGNSIGVAHYYDKNFWAHNTTLYTTEFISSWPKYIFYFLRTIDFSALNSGSAVPSLNRNHIHSIRVKIPDFLKQKAIAAVLSSFDDKIDLLHRQNNTLEAMAETLFKQWFVVEAQEGCRLEKLGDCVTISYGKNLPTKNLLAEGFPVFGANGQIGFYDRYTYEDPQVLVSCRGEASGKVNISLPRSFVTNNSLALERNKRPEISFEFLKYWALSYDFNLHVSGSAQPQITIDSLYDAEFIFPDVEVISRFTNAVKSAEEKRYTNILQIRTLEALRDTLLPKLMSGEVRVTV